MSNAIGKSLCLLIVLVSLTGCDNTQVLNSTPDAFFPSCATINKMAAPAVDDSIINAQVESTNVMLKLRDRQPAKEQIKFGKCK